MGARLIYDGACIFCDAYVRLLSLREAVGPVELIDARSGDPRLRAYQSAGYDLNEGMLFEYSGTVYDTVGQKARVPCLFLYDTIFANSWKSVFYQTLGINRYRTLCVYST